MTSRGAAIRYARALFDTTLAEQRDLLQVARDLRSFAALGREHATLGRVLTNPAIPAARKRAVVEQLIARAGALQPPLAKLLLMLAERDRLGILPDVGAGVRRAADGLPERRARRAGDGDADWRTTRCRR